ncbi:MAG TPA: hypothetical protein VFK30_07370, partial [Anaerolineae bacterium]|nr:hypothetical protein [Anaerolineae bacterium]
FVLGVVLTVPGWALLSLIPIWRDWNRLQRWCLAIGLSVAIFPVAFYGLRFVLPSFTLGPWKMSAFLAGCVVIVVWRLRGTWREQFAFDRWDWVAIGILGMTLFTRVWIVQDLPFPAWSDGMQHTVLTQLTAVKGQLPYTMDPYFPIPLGQYHMGLYALSSTVEWLANVPANIALLYTAQILNGLCVIGVFVVLDRLGGRLGAIVGATVVGLVSFQPAFYVNWGRFTQIAAQTILLVAWLVTWHTLRVWRQSKARNSPRSVMIWYAVLASVLNAAVFLLHFRVAAFYLPLLAIAAVWEFYEAFKERQVRAIIGGLLAIGVMALLFISPAVWEALRIYVQSRAGPTTVSTATPEEIAKARDAYFAFPIQTWPGLAAPIWLMVSAIISAVFATIRRNKLALVIIVWTALVLSIGEAYLLNVPLLAVTNLGAVLIMLYLPISLALGVGVEELLRWTRGAWRGRAVSFTMAMVSVAAFVGSHTAVMQVEPYRYVVTEADMTAMAWINGHTPTDAWFAVNTTFWTPDAPMGTDAGYWIPYFTQRSTTASSNLFSLGSKEYADRIRHMSQAAADLATNNAALDTLRELGVTYIYIGAKGNFDGPGLVPKKIRQVSGIDVVYQQNGVTILRIQ